MFYIFYTTPSETYLCEMVVSDPEYMILIIDQAGV